MDWRETVATLSERVFPGISNQNTNIFGNEVMSNLPLQMTLYYNVLFAPIWGIVMTLFITEHYFIYNELHKFIILCIMPTIVIVEIFRLYLAYEGNLSDKIPELAGFWMLSGLLQLPLQGLLLFNPNFEFYLLERIVSSIMFGILCLQVMFGYCALKSIARQQANYFRIMKLRNDVTLADIEERYKVK